MRAVDSVFLWILLEAYSTVGATRPLEPVGALRPSEPSLPIPPLRTMKCSLDDCLWRCQLANASVQEAKDEGLVEFLEQAKDEVLGKAAKDEVKEKVLEVLRIPGQVKEELDVHLRKHEQMTRNHEWKIERMMRNHERKIERMMRNQERKTERMMRNRERKIEHMLQMTLFWPILGLMALLVSLAVLFEKFFMRGRHPHVDSDRASSGGSGIQTVNGWGSTRGETMSRTDQTSRVARSPDVEMASSNIETVDSWVGTPATISSAGAPSAVAMQSWSVDSRARSNIPSVESWISTAATATSSAALTSVDTIPAHEEFAGRQSSFFQVAFDAVA